MKEPFVFSGKWFVSIKFRLLAFGITMSILPILLLGLYSMKTARSDLESSINKNHSMVAMRVANDTAELVSTLRTSLETMAMAESNRLLTDEKAVKERLLYTIINRYPYIEELAVVNKEGQELTKVSRRYAIGPNDLRQVALKPGVYESLQGKSYVGAARLEKDNNVVFTMAVPIFGQSEKGSLGGLIAQVSLRSVMERIASMPIGGGGYIFLVDEKGFLIGHEDFGQVVRGQSVMDSLAVQELLKGRGEGAVPTPMRYVSYTGQEVLGVYTRVRGTDWGVIIEQPTATVYGPLWDLIFKLAAAMVAVMIAAVAISVFFAFIFTRSLNALSEGVSRVSSGDLDYRIPSQGNDELGQVVEAFNAMTSELRRRRELEVSMYQTEKMAAIGLLAAGVAHEINNPVNTLSFYVTDLLERLRLEGAARLEQEGEFEFYLQDMKEQISRAATITESLLNFARPQSDRVEAVLIERLLSDVLPLIRYRFRKQGVEMTTDIVKPLPAIRASASQLQQVFLNILTNALDAMPLGGKINVSVECLDRGENRILRLVFADTGHGIPQDKLRQIFEPFYTTKPFGQGTGLGLSVCYGIISKLKGHIYAESQEGQGTKMVIELPVTEVEDGTLSHSNS